MWKKFFYFFMLFFYVLGTFGGFGYACYNEAYVIAIGVAVTGYMAFFKAKEWAESLIE